MIANPPPVLPASARASEAPSGLRDLWRPKGYLSTRSLVAVMALVVGPALMLLARMLATPALGASEWPLLDSLAAFGAALDNTLTLAWVPAGNRAAAEYLVLLPTAALLITVARLTFGLRVLGFRPVLIAVGFNELGVLPSLIVMGVVIGVVATLRPTMRRVRLPLYARISLILGITACVQVGALLVGSWLRSELVWSLAFFPIIILAMMAEAIAATLDQNRPGSAAWRFGWTVVLALVLFGLMNAPRFLELLLRAPELMVMQLGAIVLVSEYLDLRLLQDWQGRMTELAATHAGWIFDTPPDVRRKPRVAVVRNRSRHGTIGKLGPATPSRVDSVQHVADGLRDAGYAVKVLEGDMTLLRELRKFLPPHPRTGRPGGVVLNLGAGIQGRGPSTHVPAMLEMAGIAYTGPDPVGHARLGDPYGLLLLLRQAGVPVPTFGLLDDAHRAPDGVTFPMRLSARQASSAAGVRVDTSDHLSGAAALFAARYGGELLAESLIVGPEFRVAVLGDETLESLPLVRMDANGQPSECPAILDEALAAEIRRCALQAFRAAGCRDCALVRVCLDFADRPHVMGIEAQEIFGRKGALSIMAKVAGLGWSGLGQYIVEVAAARNGAESLTAADARSVIASRQTPAAAAASGAGRAGTAE